MNKARTLLIVTGAAMALAPTIARADHAWFHGRTGLPTVREAKQKIWMERGIVHLNVIGDSLEINQEFRISMPGAPLEKKGENAVISFREDYYRGHHSGSDAITPANAVGFSSWAAWIDGERVTPDTTGWELNDKKDTATRWRNLRMHFYPGTVHRVKVVSVSPLGKDVDHKTIEFVTKDLGHWRGNPDYLDIRVTMPGVTEAFLTTLEPKASAIGSNGIRWIYRKADPNRDLVIKLPTDWRRASIE